MKEVVHPIARACAGLGAAATLAGLILQLLATLAYTGDLVVSVVAMGRYFTILANLALFASLARVAAGRWPAPAWLAGTALSMIAVGLVYAILLDGFLVLPGLGAAASFCLHKLSPTLAAAYWLAFAPKGGLRLRHAVVWLGMLAAYGAYAVLRGVLDGTAVYPFLDFAERGWTSVILTNLAIGLFFLAAGFALVGLDRRLAGRAGVH